MTGTRPGGLLHGHANDFAVFFHVHGGRFARGAHHADAVGAFGNVPVDEFAQGGVIDAAVLKHGGDQGDDAAFKATVDVVMTARENGKRAF